MGRIVTKCNDYKTNVTSEPISNYANGLIFLYSLIRNYDKISYFLFIFYFPAGGG